MQKHDVAAAQVTGPAGRQVRQNVVRYLLGSVSPGLVAVSRPHAVAPIVRVNPVANRDVTHVLCERERTHLVGGVRFLVNRVRRTQQRDSNSDQTGEKPLGQVQLHLHVSRRNVAHVRMGKRVVADAMTFVINAFCQARELVGLNADEEKCCGSVLMLEHIEDLRRPLRIGAVVKSERDQVATVTVTRHAIRFGQVLKIFVGDHLGVRIDGEVASAGGGTILDAQNLPLALHVHVLAGRHAAQFVGGAGIPRNIPYAPQRPVLAAQSPKSKSLDAQRLRGPHVVQSRHRIEKPDVMANAALIQITEMGVQRVIVENHIFIGIARCQPCFLHGDRTVMCAGRQFALLRLEHPVIAIVGDGAD